MVERIIAVAIASTGIILLGAGPARPIYKSPNFAVEADTVEIAKRVALTAEYFRRELAIEWLGKEMQPWYEKCRVTVRVGQVGAGGLTKFKFQRGESGEMEVFDWNMRVQGSLDRILDSVIPHEITHTILACRFRRPLPRWADEGAATLSEIPAEKARQRELLGHAIRTGRRIPLARLLTMKQYPSDRYKLLTLYAEGYSLASFLISKGGKSRYLAFLDYAHQHGWDKAIRTHYKEQGVTGLERRWSSWVMAGSPSLSSRTQLVAATKRKSNSKNQVIRAQNPVSRTTSITESKSHDHTTPSSTKVAALIRRVGFGGHAVIRYGAGLHAPDPRKNRIRQVLAVTSERTVVGSTGDRRVVETGWVAVGHH